MVMLALLVCNPAQAQLGGLLKKAKKAVKQKTESTKKPASTSTNNPYSSAKEAARNAAKSDKEKMLDNFKPVKEWPFSMADTWFKDEFKEKDITAKIKEKFLPLKARYSADSALYAEGKNDKKVSAHDNFYKLRDEIEEYEREMDKVRSELNGKMEQLEYNYKFVDKDGKTYVQKYGSNTTIDPLLLSQYNFALVNCKVLFGENDPDIVENLKFQKKLLAANRNSASADIKEQLNVLLQEITMLNKLVKGEDGKLYVAALDGTGFVEIVNKEGMKKYKKAIATAEAGFGKNDPDVKKHTAMYKGFIEGEKNSKVKIEEARIEYLKYKPEPSNVKGGAYALSKMKAAFKRDFPNCIIIDVVAESANTYRHKPSKGNGWRYTSSEVVFGQALLKCKTEYHRIPWSFHRDYYDAYPNDKTDRVYYNPYTVLPESGVPAKYRR